MTAAQSSHGLGPSIAAIGANGSMNCRLASILPPLTWNNSRHKEEFMIDADNVPITKRRHVQA